MTAPAASPSASASASRKRNSRPPAAPRRTITRVASARPAGSSSTSKPGVAAGTGRGGRRGQGRSEEAAGRGGPGGEGWAGLEQTPDGDDAAEQHQTPAEHHRHVARPHAQRGPARIIAGDPEPGGADGRKHQPGDEVTVDVESVHVSP